MKEQPKIKVDLFDFTSDAASKLIFTKSTRLNMTPNLFHEISTMGVERKKEELEYMSRTIPSSWEFVNYSFIIQNVTRGFTHQFVRTRQGSYAQQTMRILEMAEFSYRIPPRIAQAGGELLEVYIETMEHIQHGYDRMIELKAEVEDARGVLPTNIHTNIACKFNLRTMSELARSRTGTRTQDEYREVLDMMLDEILKVHPWADSFLFPKGRDICKNLEELIKKAEETFGGLGKQFLIDCKKDLDLLRKG